MQKEYTLLFNTLTDLLQELQTLQQAIVNAQIQAEALYLEREDQA